MTNDQGCFFESNMPTNYSGRITLICTVLILSLLAIFWGPPSRLFDPHLTVIQKTNLRPGIDMVGGVSLVYAIQAPTIRTPIFPSTSWMP